LYGGTAYERLQTVNISKSDYGDAESKHTGAAIFNDAAPNAAGENEAQPP